MNRPDTYRAAAGQCKTGLRKSLQARLYRRLRIRNFGAIVRSEIFRDLQVKKKRALVFALIHFSVLAVAFILAFSWTMSRFDTGKPVTMPEIIAGGTVNVLTVRLVWLRHIPIDQGLVDILQWPLIVLTRLLWGFAAEFIYSRVSRR